MLNRLRGFARLLIFICYSSWTVASILLMRVIRPSDVTYGLRRRKIWAQRQLKLLNVRITVEGEAPECPCILMANHRSYLDPILILCDTVAMAVSKAEVADWPLIGAGAKASGVIFLQRENPASRKRTLHAIEAAVREGYPVILFPEGTTHSHVHIMPFRRGGFQLAAVHGFTIVPVAVNYRFAADSWTGGETFLPHFLRRFGEPQIEARVSYGPFLSSPDANLLFHQCTEWINSRLTQWQAEGWNQ